MKKARAELSDREFVDVAAHELQQPLTTIKLLAENLLAGRAGNLDPKQLSEVQAVQRTALRAIALVKDLLTVARLEGGRLGPSPKPGDLVTFVRNTVRKHEPSFREYSATVHVDLPKTPIQGLPFDPIFLGQALDNLLSNAVKYNPTGTHVDVAIARSGSAVTIAVRNDGPPIPPLKLKGLFQKFVRAPTAGTAKVGGTGLGLFITKELVERSGGTIAVTSAPKKGTTFTITLPFK